VTVKLEQDLAPMDRRNGERASEVKIDEPKRSRDDMKWIISFVDWLVHVLHQHWRRWNGNAQGKGIIYGILFYRSKVV
jgi:hypothetical protein